MKTLLDKYLFIHELRFRSTPADRASLQRLARAFPGALRELELLPPAQLSSRIQQLQSGAPDWAQPMAIYHRHLRRILIAKQSGDGATLTEREKAALTQLPRGRISQLALCWTSTQVELDAVELRKLLWPLIP